MLDRAAFLRPIAHRGLHDPARGRIENTAPAFEAAIAKGYGIECDLRPLEDGTPVVFHDDTLDRLVDGTGPVAALTPGQASRLRYKGQDVPIITYADFLDLVAGRAPLLVEIKSEWTEPDARFLEGIAALSTGYKGPLALMSFDPDVMVRMRTLAPAVPRGIVAGVYQGAGWWLDRIGQDRAFRLTHLLESGPVEPSFYSYHVKALPTPVTRYAREVQKLPLFCWTVRTAEERARAEDWSDAPTFEGYEP
jgi:glycerophosphoryl diester phosphodiesterase